MIPIGELSFDYEQRNVTVQEQLGRVTKDSNETVFLDGLIKYTVRFFTAPVILLRGNEANRLQLKFAPIESISDVPFL